MSLKVENYEATLNHVKGLAFNRSTGTVGETEAIMYIKDALQKENITSRLDYFDYIGPKRLLMRIAYVIIFSYLLLFKLLLVLALYFSIKYLSAKARNFSLVGKESSKNLITEFPAKISRVKRPVAIITAHYDSFSANLPYRLQGVLFFVFRIIIIPYLGITLVFSIWILIDFNQTNAEEITNLILLTSIVEFFIIFLIFLLIYNTKESMGAIDNASGVSILIEIAQHLNKHPLENMDVIIIFVGAEEWGLIGSKRYLESNRKYLEEKYDLNRSFNINYDMIGSYIGLCHKKGIFNKKRINKTLNDYIDDAAKKLNVKYLKQSHIINPKTDHRSFLKFAKKTKSKFQVACFHSDKDSKYIHSPKDVPERCSSINLNGVLEISLEVLHKVDSELYS